MSAPLHHRLLALFDEGMVSRRTKGYLAIYNYTAACNYGKHWEPVARQARGLILHEPTSAVVARPFPKFFNLNELPETSEDTLPWDDPFEVSMKVDGSLGVVYHHDGRWDIATRGAFDSDQAIFARENLLPRYRLDRIPEDLTVLVEIVYPGNRVVVDYGDLEFLSLLAARNRVTGAKRGRDELVGLSSDLDMSLASPMAGKLPRDFKFLPNTEGFVIHWPDNGLRVKVKAPDYVAAHRLLPLVSPRRVLELMAEGRVDDVAAQLPGHVRARFDEILGSLTLRLERLRLRSLRAFKQCRGALEESRKAFALMAKEWPVEVQPLLFAMASRKSDGELDALSLRILEKQVKAEVEP